MATASPNAARAEHGPNRRLLGLYLLLGFSAGLPFYMFNAVLTLRLARHGVDIAVVGFFAWVALLPTFKFLWAPLLERWSVPGFGRFWGRRRGWIMLSQLGIFTAMLGMAFTSSDASLPLTALFAVTLAFWTTTLEIAADGWRIELAPTQAEQGPVVAANLWGYRSAMVAAGSGAVWVAAKADWTWAYLVIAAAAFLPFPILAAMRGEERTSGRFPALLGGIAASAVILTAATALTAGLGWLLLGAASAAGIDSDSNVTPSYWRSASCRSPCSHCCCRVSAAWAPLRARAARLLSGPMWTSSGATASRCCSCSASSRSTAWAMC